MLRSFLPLFICCVGSSAAQVEFIEHPEDLSIFNYRPAAKPDCGPNEVLNECVPCPPEDTCYDSVAVVCSRSFSCQADCLCKPGFIRKTADGECIPLEECDCGPNEVLNECVPCPPENTCYDSVGVVCSRSFSCQADCLCKPGFIRKTADGECIPLEECGRRCGRNEEYTECKESCSNETCALIGTPVKCNSEESCVPGCACQPGYYRDEDVEDSGCIIPECLCPQIKGSPDCSSWKIKATETPQLAYDKVDYNFV